MVSKKTQEIIKSYAEFLKFFTELEKKMQRTPTNDF